MRIVEYIVTAIYNILMDLIEAFEEFETPKVIDAYSNGKKSIFEPSERVWERFQAWATSSWGFFDSLVGGVAIPVVDSSVAYVKGLLIFGCKQTLELGYQLDIAIIAICAPFVTMMKTVPVMGELIVAIEFCLKYILVDYLEFDYEAEDTGESPMAYTKDGKPAAAKFRTAKEMRKSGGKPEMIGRTSIRPEKDSSALPID